MGFDNVGFKVWNPVFEELSACWREAWNAGTILVIDESMVAWEGATSAHLTLIPRKPTPLGFMFKTLGCASSNILVNLEAVEGAEIDRQKKWVQEFKATTACTLRLTEPYANTGRICIGESWFGSTRTCEELAEQGIYSVMSIKKGSKDFPKKTLLDAMKERGDV